MTVIQSEFETFFYAFRLKFTHFGSLMLGIKILFLKVDETFK